MLSYKAITLKPDYYQAFYNLANTLKDLSKYHEAAEIIKAIALKPDFAEAYNNLGLTFKELDKYEDALNSINQAIILSPKNPRAFYNLGIIYKDIEKFDESVENYKAIALKPDFAEAYNNLGDAFIVWIN